jgi:hypothetical protein
MSNRSDGEETYAQGFQFRASVAADSQEELRDFLYKFAHNYNEAAEDLQLLKQIDEINYDSKSDLLFKINTLALQVFALDMRRMTDKSSKRSLQRLLPKVVSPKTVDSDLAAIQEIHAHYKSYVDKGVAHQDELSIKTVLSSFPDTEVIEKDMEHLSALYYKIVKDMAVSYMKLSSLPDYSKDLKKLL